MAAIKITENLYSVGILNPNMRIFDVVMRTEYGTTYNSYLLRGEQKTALIETCHKTYFEQYLKNIREVVDTEEIDYIILNHCEPDHSGALAELLSLCPRAEILVSRAGAIYLKNITNREDLKIRFVKDGESIDLGGRQLRFISAPFLHWPDSMFTWMPQQKVLFTCDFLGAHFCEPTMLDSNIHYPEQYLGEVNYYYACIFGPFKPYVLAGLDKIKDLPVEMVCPSHGPCLVEGISRIQGLYREWSTPAAPSGKKVVGILHASAYGCTTKLAQAAYDELKKNPDLDVRLMNVVFTPLSEAAALANEADALLVGSCTINRDAPKVVWDVLASVAAINTKQKPVGAFGSYGWSGEAVPMIKSRMEHLKFKFIGDGLRVCFMPTEEDFDAMRAYAKEVVSNLK